MNEFSLEYLEGQKHALEEMSEFNTIMWKNQAYDSIVKNLIDKYISIRQESIEKRIDLLFREMENASE